MMQDKKKRDKSKSYHFFYFVEPEGIHTLIQQTTQTA